MRLLRSSVFHPVILADVLQALARGAAVVAALSGPLLGQSVIQGVTATATSWWTMPDTTNPYQSPVNLINSGGLSVPNDINATHSANGDAMLQWHAKSWAEDPNPVLTFTLGGAFDLDAVHIWNGNQGRAGQDNTGRGVKSFTLSVSTDGTSFSNVLTSDLTRSPYVSGNVGPISAQHFSLTGRNGIKVVKIRVNSIHDPANPYACLSEVMFTAVEKFTPVAIKAIKVEPSVVTLTIPSTPGQKFAIFRSTDLATGFDVPLVKNLAAATDLLMRTGMITEFANGATLGDNSANFDTILTAGTSYVFIPGSGLSAGQLIPVLAWSGETVTIAKNIADDLDWTGNYTIRTTVPTETKWVDTTPPPGKAFYKAATQ
jgi:hypothetical protein